MTTRLATAGPAGRLAYGHRVTAGRDRAAERDRSVDAVRAVAIAGVVLGHWLVTALVLAPDGGLRVDSPLRALSWLTPATWVLQTLGLFFFVGGFAAARSRASARARGERYGGWLGARLRRLAGAVGLLGVVWAAALTVAAAAGAPYTSLRTAATLVISPLWFLAAFAALTALTGPIRRAATRWGPAATLPAVGVVAAGDAGVGLLPVTLVAAWLVPYLLGVLVADGRLSRRRAGWSFMVGGAAGMAALVLAAGYPASAVGVPGAGESNLNPPSLVAVGLAVAQTGLALLVRPYLRRWMARPVWWAPVAAVNRRAMVIFLWHQSALIAVSVVARWLAGGDPLPGLHTPPVDAAWLVVRLGWLPVFAGTLAAVTPTVAGAGRGGPIGRGASGRSAHRAPRPSAV